MSLFNWRCPNIFFTQQKTKSNQHWTTCAFSASFFFFLSSTSLVDFSSITYLYSIFTFLDLFITEAMIVCASCFLLYFFARERDCLGRSAHRECVDGGGWWGERESREVRGRLPFNPLAVLFFPASPFFARSLKMKTTYSCLLMSFKNSKRDVFSKRKTKWQKETMSRFRNN